MGYYCSCGHENHKREEIIKTREMFTGRHKLYCSFCGHQLNVIRFPNLQGQTSDAKQQQAK